MTQIQLIHDSDHILKNKDTSVLQKCLWKCFFWKTETPPITKLCQCPYQTAAKWSTSWGATLHPNRQVGFYSFHSQTWTNQRSRFFCYTWNLKRNQTVWPQKTLPNKSSCSAVQQGLAYQLLSSPECCFEWRKKKTKTLKEAADISIALDFMLREETEEQITAEVSWDSLLRIQESSSPGISKEKAVEAVAEWASLWVLLF